MLCAMCHGTTRFWACACGEGMCRHIQVCSECKTSRVRPKAYVVPVAEKGFERVDPVTNPISYALDDADGRMIEIAGRSYWPSLKAARKAAENAGYQPD